jgi:hypothetical protein
MQNLKMAKLPNENWYAPASPNENWYAPARTRLTIGIPIAGILALGGCAQSASGKLCPLEPPSVTRDAAHDVMLPVGCRLVGQSEGTTHEIVCDDGRTGWAFD